MTVIGEAFIAVRPQVTPQGFERELQQSVVPAGQKVAKTLAAAIGGAFVVSKLKGFAQAGIAELEQAAAAQAQTAAVIKSTGGVANVTAKDIENLAGAQMRLTGVDDELIQSGANKLATFTRVRNEVGKGNDIFNQATVAALDLSRAGFGSVESASVLLGKALNDPVQGLTALQRVGVRLTDDQKALVKELVATGDTLGAQKVILEEVNTQVGGSAKAYGETLPGKLAIARESLANTQGQLLAGMAPALTLTADATTFLTDQFAKQPEALQAVEGGLLLVVGGLASVITPLKSGIDLWRSFSRGAEVAASATELAAASSVTSATGVAQVGTAAANSAASVGTLYTNSGRAAGGLKGLAGAGVGVVTQLGLIIAATQLLDREASRASLPKLTRDLLDFTEGGKATGELTDTLGEDFRTLQNAIEDIAKPSNAAQISNVVSTLASFGTQHGTRGSLDDSRAVIADLDDALTSLAQQDPAAAAAALKAVSESLSPQDAERLKGLLDNYNDQLATIDTNSRTAAGGVDDLTGATGDQEDATEDTTDALADYEQKLKDARDAVDELFSSTEGAIDAEFRYKDSQDSTADALARLTELRKEGKAGTDEYRRAQDDAAEALFRQAQAAGETAEQQYALAGQTLDAAGKATVQKRELERLRDTLAPNSPLRERLQGMIDKLAVIPERKKITIDVLTGQAFVELDRLARRLVDQGILTPGQARVLADGGEVKPLYMASGGRSVGPKGTDTVPAWLTPGEFVFSRDATNRWGLDTLAAMNGSAPSSVPAMAGGHSGAYIAEGAIQVVAPQARASDVADEVLSRFSWELTTRDDW